MTHEDLQLDEVRRFLRTALGRLEREPVNTYQAATALIELEDAVWLLDRWLDAERIPVTGDNT